MAEITIEQIVDSCLQKWIDRGLNKRPGKIEREMAGETNKEGWTTWFPILVFMTRNSVNTNASSGSR